MKPGGGRCPPGPNGGRRDAHSATPILLRGSLITRRWGGGVIDIDKKAPLARRPHHPKGDDSPLGKGPDTIATARQPQGGVEHINAIYPIWRRTLGRRP